MIDKKVWLDTRSLAGTVFLVSPGKTTSSIDWLGREGIAEIVGRKVAYATEEIHGKIFPNAARQTQQQERTPPSQAIPSQPTIQRKSCYRTGAGLSTRLTTSSIAAG